MSQRSLHPLGVFPTALRRGNVGVIKPSDCGAASSFSLLQSPGLLKVRLGGSFMFLQYDICGAITYQMTEAWLRCCHGLLSWLLPPTDEGWHFFQVWSDVINDAEAFFPLFLLNMMNQMGGGAFSHTQQSAPHHEHTGFPTVHQLNHVF